MDSFKTTIVGACELTGIAAGLLLLPLAAIDGFDGLDLFAVALAVLSLLAALAIRVSEGG